jgi:hypothetical protein
MPNDLRFFRGLANALLLSAVIVGVVAALIERLF